MNVDSCLFKESAVYFVYIYNHSMSSFITFSFTVSLMSVIIFQINALIPAEWNENTAITR